MKLSNLRIIIGILIFGSAVFYFSFNFGKIRKVGTIIKFLREKDYNQMNLTIEVFDINSGSRVSRKTFLAPLFYDKSKKLVFWSRFKKISLSKQNENHFNFLVNRKKVLIEKCIVESKELYCLKHPFYTVYLPQSSVEEEICLKSFSDWM